MTINYQRFLKNAHAVHHSIYNTLSCKKGGFISQRHHMLCDVTTKLMEEVCNDIMIGPALQPLTGEDLKERTANYSDKARLDASERSFWVTGQQAFFDIRIFNAIARRYSDLEMTKMYDINEKEKKRHYNERVQQIEHGSFSPLVFSALEGMARKCRAVYKRLIQLLAEKRKEETSLVAAWVRRKIRDTRKTWEKDYLGSAVEKSVDVSEIGSRIF